MNAANAVYGIVVRDLSRAFRQKGRLVGGLARSFMWLLLVGAGFNSIASVGGAPSYQAFIFPGIIVMATFFGAMLTSISTVYDREFGMLRLMLASPAGVGAVLTGRLIAATTIGTLQGLVVMVFVPLVTPVTALQLTMAAGAVVLGAAASGVLGLLVAAPLRSVENYAAVINVVLFPLLFLSGALYPTERLPALMRGVVLLNPVTYAVDLTRTALGQPSEFGATRSILVLAGVTVVLFLATIALFDPERRFTRRSRPPGG